MIREINDQDAPDMAELMVQLSAYPINKTPDMVDAIKNKISDIAECEHIKIFGYENDGKIVGTCTLGRIEGLSKGCRPFAVIENVVVLDSMRVKGIGKQLVRHAMKQAEEWNCYKVILETGTKDDWKLQFYEKCGLSRGEKTAFIKRF